MLYPLIEALILGLIQGLTEFIPVSSSGHLLLAGILFSFSQNGFAFELALNVGTLAALVWYFRRDLMVIIKSLIIQRDYKLVGFLIIATIPAVVAGVLFLPVIESSLRSPYVTVSALILLGLVMLFIDKLSAKRQLSELKASDALLIGLAQAVALIPGTSRSGATIIAGRLLKLSNEAAARFSFLMAIPIISGALASLFLKPDLAVVFDKSGVLIVGILASFVSGVLAIKFLMNFIKNNGLKWFGVYRIIFGGVVLLLLLIKGNI